MLCIHLTPWEIFHAFLLSADFFSKSTFLKNFFQEYHKCQTVWIQTRPDILSGLIWVKTVCKGYQQTALGCQWSDKNFFSFRKKEKFFGGQFRRVWWLWHDGNLLRL